MCVHSWCYYVKRSFVCPIQWLYESLTAEPFTYTNCMICLGWIVSMVNQSTTHLNPTYSSRLACGVLPTGIKHYACIESRSLNSYHLIVEMESAIAKHTIDLPYEAIFALA